MKEWTSGDSEVYRVFGQESTLQGPDKQVKEAWAEQSRHSVSQSQRPCGEGWGFRYA